MHNTLRRPLSSSGGLNTTLEDDVFYDDEAPNSAKPLINESRQFYLQNFPHLSSASGKTISFSVSTKVPEADF
jgi:hypothetical protein